MEKKEETKQPSGSFSEVWENEVKESYSGMYRQVYADEERVLLCVFVTDVQYDPENREKKMIDILRWQIS